MVKIIEKIVSQETVRRRTVLEWMGKATVFSLSSGFLAACAADSGGDSAGNILGDDDDNDDSGEPGDFSFPFTPQTLSGENLKRWNVRLVDAQNVQKIVSNWKLQVDGMVENNLTLTFEDILALPRHDQVTDLHCVEGWSVYDIPWNGIHMSQLIEQVKPSPDATHVTFHTFGGIYNESVPIEVATEERTMLGYGVNGSTLPLDHGFPLRLVIPRLLGYKNAKFVERIEFTNEPIKGYWVAYGYGYDGEVPDSRLRPDKY